MLGAITVVFVSRFQHAGSSQATSMGSNAGIGRSAVSDPANQRGSLRRPPYVPVEMTVSNAEQSVIAEERVYNSSKHDQSQASLVSEEKAENILLGLAETLGRDLSEIPSEMHRSLIDAILTRNYAKLQEISGVRPEVLSAEQLARVSALLGNGDFNDNNSREGRKTQDAEKLSTKAVSPYDADELARQAHDMGLDDEQSLQDKNSEGSRLYLDAVNSSSR